MLQPQKNEFIVAVNKLKNFNDPVYGFISIPCDLVYDIIAHPFFQRLRRINQLGLSNYVYPGAQHTRFQHVIGAMSLMQQAVETFRFNVAIARAMELVNVTRKAIDTGVGAADPAVREAAQAVAIILSLVAPYTAEDMWMRLGHEPAVALAGWPVVDPALLVEDSVICVVQIAGKVRERLEVSPDISEADLREPALAAVADAIAGQELRTVIVRAPKLVNIVPA